MDLNSNPGPPDLQSNMARFLKYYNYDYSFNCSLWVATIPVILIKVNISHTESHTQTHGVTVCALLCIIFIAISAFYILDIGH